MVILQAVGFLCSPRKSCFWLLLQKSGAELSSASIILQKCALPFFHILIPHYNPCVVQQQYICFPVKRQSRGKRSLSILLGDMHRRACEDELVQVLQNRKMYHLKCRIKHGKSGVESGIQTANTCHLSFNIIESGRVECKRHPAKFSSVASCPFS